MALPLIPIALGGAAILILALTSSKSSPGGGGGSPASPGPVPPAPPGQSPNAMPAQLKAAYEDLLANGRDPNKMEEVAAELERYGFTNEGSRLRARAAQLRAAQNVPQVTPTVGPSFPIPVSPPSVPGPTMTAKVTTVTEPLVIRTTPDASVPGPVAQNVAGTAPPGATVTVLNPVAAPPSLNAPSGWAQISYGGKTGYASKQFLSGLGGGGGQLPVPPAVTPTSGPQTAIVTTSAPASDPLSNLKFHPTPSETSPMNGFAPKGSTVIVLNWMGGPATPASSMGWAQVSYNGVTGYASKNFLTLSPSISGVVVGANGEVFRCAAPSGCYLRAQPSVRAASGAIVAHGDQVRLLSHAPGKKAEAASPGQGGWAKVAYGARIGWVPSEWLV